MPTERRHPIWLYPNLLSLDAPLVAVAWLHIFATTWRLYIPWQAYASLGLAVWTIYAFDRILDSALSQGNPSAPPLEARHRFHFRHRAFFTTAIIAAFVATVFLVVTTMPMAIYRNLLVGGVLVAGFFGLSMMRSGGDNEPQFLKNSLAGITFAFGTSMVAHVFRAEFDLHDLLTSRDFLCFAVLCVLNIAAVDLWEHSARSHDEEIKASDELALTLPLTLLALAAIVFALQNEPSRPFYYAILTGAGLLYGINRRRDHLSGDSLRALADAAMLAPWLVFTAASYG